MNYPLYKVDVKFTKSDADFSDFSKNIVLNYETDNKEILNNTDSNELNNLIKKQLCLKLDVIQQRLDISCDKENNNIYITINPKTKNSNEKETKDLFLDIQSLCANKISIKKNKVEILKIVGAVI